MGSIIERIPRMSIDGINTLCKNAQERLDNPKYSEYAQQVLAAIDQELERHYLPGMIVTFRKRYPGGFYGDTQAEEERNYKVYASDQFQELLGKKEFSSLLTFEQYEELYSRVATLVGLTNLIQGSFEKPKLLDAIRANLPTYMKTLFKCIYGSEGFAIRFDEFVSTLAELQLRKWTYATYFLFLSDPNKYMFVKPEMLKKSLTICKYPLYYKSTPSSGLYEEILKYSEWLKQKINELRPREMIDVHSFMWHMAPTGKWCED